jgi:hypothetical protein
MNTRNNRDNISSEATTPLPIPGPERRTPSLAELAAEQGLSGPQDFDAIFGAGCDLWSDDADFEAYLADLRVSRRTGE